MSVVIIEGDEEFLMERASLEEAPSSLVDDVVNIEYSKFLKFDHESPSYDGKSICFIVKNCPSDLNLNINQDNHNIFVLKCGLSFNGKGQKVFRFEKLKQDRILKWIMKEGERLNIDLSRVAGALFVNCGDRLRKIHSEIEKIRTIVSNGAIVSPDEAKSVLCFTSEVTPKNILDALSNGKTAVALSFYDKLQEIGNETGWILAYIHSFVLQLLRSKFMNDRKNIEDVLGINSYVYNNFVAPHADKWTVESLILSATTLSEIDLKNKSGEVISNFMLEAEIIRLSEEASIFLKSKTS